MGVSGLWKLLEKNGAASTKSSLMQLSIEEGYNISSNKSRIYRVGIDCSIWMRQVRDAKGGDDPELRILFQRCTRLLSMPIKPIFVFDGPKRPKLKHGRTQAPKEPRGLVLRWIEMLKAFGFMYIMAPGEAKAQLASLNQNGVIDAIISEDVDCFLFGATTVIREPLKIKRGNTKLMNTPIPHLASEIMIYQNTSLLKIGLARGGLILIGLMSGNDYDTTGIDGCGIQTAYTVAQTGLGDSLFNATQELSFEQLEEFIIQWRRGVFDLISSSHLELKRKKVSAALLCEDFPCLQTLRYYSSPIICNYNTAEFSNVGDNNTPNLADLAIYCAKMLSWSNANILRTFKRSVWPGAALAKIIQLTGERDPSAVSDHEGFILKICGIRSNDDSVKDSFYNYQAEIDCTCFLSATLAGLRSLPGAEFAETDSDTCQICLFWLPTPCIRLLVPNMAARFDNGARMQTESAPSGSEPDFPSGSDIIKLNPRKRKKSLGPSSDSDLSSGSDTSDVKIIEVKLPEKSLVSKGDRPDNAIDVSSSYASDSDVKIME